MFDCGFYWEELIYEISNRKSESPIQIFADCTLKNVQDLKSYSELCF